MTKKTWNTLQPLLLPLLIAVYPSLFYYAGNVDITDYPSLLRACLINGGIAIVVSLFFGVVHRGNLWRGAVYAFVFMAFFSIYGILYDLLLKLDYVTIEHYTLLPLIILMSLYASWFIGKLNISKLSRVGGYGFLILTGLVLFNLVQILSVEVAKAKEVTQVSGVSVEPKISESINYPDIYYIVLDEFAGFEAMRQYWKYDGVDNFKKFLEDKNFFVAEQSHSESITTLYELATRLNYQEYSCCDDYRTYFSAIGDNRVMQFLKTKGYTTLAFDQSGSAFPTDVPVTADYFYAKAQDTYAPPAFIDDFVKMVIDRTMLRVFSNIYEPIFNSPSLKAHTEMLSFTLNKVGDLEDIPSPKFVYVHVLLPHMPFIYDKNGFIISSAYNTNWEDYLGNYIYSMSYAEKMITSILEQADPDNPPVIILQSDHGARNQIYQGNEEHLLKDYAEEYTTWILFTINVPGMDMSNIPQDVDPFNTFPIVFNYLFDANIPLR